MSKKPPSIEEKIVFTARKFASSVGVSEHQRPIKQKFFARLFGFPPQSETYLIVTVHTPPALELQSVTASFAQAIDKISVEHNVQIQWTIQESAFMQPSRARSRAV